MALYTVYLPNGRRDAAALEEAALLRDGFSWPAFFLSGLWLLWHRLWLAFALYVVLIAAIAFAARSFGLGTGASFALEVLLGLAVGFEGASLRALKLERRGYALATVVAARDQERAERKAFAALAGEAPALPARPAPTASAPAPRRDEEIVGLFPQPGGGA